jgi:hypothetical protein
VTAITASVHGDPEYNETLREPGIFEQLVSEYMRRSTFHPWNVGRSILLVRQSNRFERISYRSRRDLVPLWILYLVTILKDAKMALSANPWISDANSHS